MIDQIKQYIEEVKIKDKAKAEDFDKLAKRYADK